ncbi:thioredoxin trp26 family protein [Moniliophthora roreri MCA 2997]|uniref:Thioredoxin trp26 family protein n=1 Tax=Moniliophthora roreri (strain MCA 2997) TaxID=1381753 RepID=V2X915_MONRO|nr:thioredoxin trp26 family protein [Moniliophthora roreri MCA 2997]
MDHHHYTGCGHESHDHDHDHDHEHEQGGAQDNLYQHIDRQHVVALNASDNGKGPDVIKPWHERLGEEKFVESDADDQLILRIPFTGSVKLRSLLLKSGPTDQTPAKVLVFANENNLDFDDVADRSPTQEFDVAQGREVGEYAVKTAKFNNVSSLTLFFPRSQGAENVRIYYIGLLGTWTERNQQPVIAVYEAQANLADHEKIQGTDSLFSAPQT